MEVMKNRRRKSQLKIDKERAMTVYQQLKMATMTTTKLKCINVLELDR